MRRVVENPKMAAKRAHQGQRDILEKHGVASCAKVLNQRLEDTRHNRQTTRPVAAATAGRIEPSPAAGATRHSSVATAMAAATALLTPVEGLPPTARFRGVRLRLQQLLLRGMRAYWWQQRSLQSALIDGVKAVDLESKRRYEELLQRTVRLETVVSSEHDVQDGAGRQLKALTTHLGEAARELKALTTQLGAVAAESRTLQHRLYAQPYMADPKQFLVADERGRPQLGFDDGSVEGPMFTTVLKTSSEEPKP